MDELSRLTVRHGADTEPQTRSCLWRNYRDLDSSQVLRYIHRLGLMIVYGYMYWCTF